MSEEADLSRVADLEADNARLRRLLDKQGAASELRHRSRSTLALLRNIVRRSADAKRDVDTYVAHLEDRLDAIARAQAAADEHGVVNLTKLLHDGFHHYLAEEGVRYVIDDPEIDLQPRAGQVVGLAIHELIVNSVEHGAIGAGEGAIRVAWRIENEKGPKFLVFTWEEEIAETASAPREGFGKNVLTRMVEFELQATTRFEISAKAFRYSARMPFPDTIGALVYASRNGG